MEKEKLGESLYKSGENEEKTGMGRTPPFVKQPKSHESPEERKWCESYHLARKV